MKVHVITAIVYDHEDIGADGVVVEMERAKYIYPRVKDIHTYDVGEWDDNHPLNQCGTDVLSYLSKLKPE